MPRIAQSAESGDIHSHVFVALLPKDTLGNPAIPNSCQTCHRHKDQDLKALQAAFDTLAVLPKPVGAVVKVGPIPTVEKPKKADKPQEAAKPKEAPKPKEAGKP
jgi:hypothetical protein